MTTRRAFMGSLAGAAALAGCGVVPERPQRPVQYDFGPGPAGPTAGANTGAASNGHPGLPPLALGDVEASSALDSSSLLYRLGYADANQLQPYARARWSAPVPQLVRQRLRERLAQDRVVMDLADSATLARTGGAMPRILRVQLEEFSQWFDSAATSWGQVRLRATLTDNTPAGEKIVAQRSVAVRRPAPTADAAGGVRALADAAAAAADEIAQWLEQQPAVTATEAAHAQ